MLKADTLAVYKKCAVKSFAGKFKDEYRKIKSLIKAPKFLSHKDERKF